MTFSRNFLDTCGTAFPELKECVDSIVQKRDAVKFGRKKAAAIVPILTEMCRLERAERVPLMIKLLLVLSRGEGERVVGQYQKMNRTQERINKVRAYVVCNARKGITLDEVARHVGMSRNSFCVFFKKATGKTFVTYLNEYRIGLACQRLEQHNASITEICYQSGFNDISYFSRIFKNTVGVSPRQYAGRGK